MGHPYPGLWTFDHHPWLKEMHDCKATIKVGQKAAQCGYTEWALNESFYFNDIRRMDVLYVLPNTRPDAADFSSSRFDKALELSEHLRKLYSEVQNVGHKRAGSTNLFIRGSNSRLA
jgi:phage terminase large subunit GpA-like protein